MEPLDGLTVLIPARGGSKTVPDKNLRLVNNVPLVVHVANVCRQVGQVVVTTDSPRIAAVCKMHGIPTLARPAELADDEATVDEVVVYHLDNNHVPYPLLVVQPTVPEITARQLVQFIDSADQSGVDSAVLAVPHPHIMWNSRGLAVNDERSNRQDMEPLAREIGIRYHRETSAPPTNVVPMLSVHPLTDIDTLARTLFGEARGELYGGRVAVANVIINRAASQVTWWGNTVEEVCRKPKQFSCWDLKFNKPNYLFSHDELLSFNLFLLIASGFRADRGADGKLGFPRLIGVWTLL